jgi:hypothetical protein
MPRWIADEYHPRARITTGRRGSAEIFERAAGWDVIRGNPGPAFILIFLRGPGHRIDPKRLPRRAGIAIPTFAVMKARAWILLLPFLGLLWVPFYNFSTPSLGGFPFFYWYLFLWVPITSLLIYIVHRGTK